MKKIIIILMSFMSLVSFSEIKKSSNAAFSIVNNAQDSTKLTAKDYIQDGLVVMWDGIENIGWNTHDENSREWIDLIGYSSSLILNSQTYFTKNALVRQGKDGRIMGYPNINWSNPLSERTLEFVMSAEGMPINPTANYYFFAMQSNGGANRIIWSGSNPRVSITLRAAAGIINTTITNNDITQPNTFSLVGTSIKYSDTRNIAMYFLNGDNISRTNIFGGDPIVTPQFNIFADTRAWPEDNTIRIHCIRFYNRALSEEEIKHNRKIDELRFNL